jgi:hypothetical protein
MIDIPERWNPRWKSTAQSRCVCWRIVRKDGVTLRFTSWDRPVWIGSEVFIPSDDESSASDEGGGGQVTGDKRGGGLREHAAGLSGVISSDSISEDDLLAGRFEGATLTTFQVDALNPSAGYVERSFQVADVTWSTDGSWQFSLVSAIDTALQRKRGEVVSRNCRHALFGPGCARERTPGGSDGLVADEWEIGQTSGNFCTVSAVTAGYSFRVQLPAATISAISTGSAIPDATAFTTATNHYFCGESPAVSRPLHVPMLVYGNVGSSPDFNGTWEAVSTNSSSPDRNLIVSGIDVTTAGGTLGFCCLAPVADWFARGQLVWSSGDNLGVPARISSSTAFTASPSSGFGGYVDIELEVAPPADVQVGDTCTLIVGCDKRITTCSSKFGNEENFNGEPYTPSGDILLYTPSSK